MTGWNYATTWETLAREVPDRVAVVCGGRRLTFAALDQRAERLAQVLAAHGIGPGDAVAISLTNRPEYLEAFFGALKLGAAPVNLNYQYVAGELAYVLADCDARAVVFHAGTTDADGTLRANGGRVLTVTAVAPTFREAQARSKLACEMIEFPGKVWRGDIGWRESARTS